jgi:signal transduction protein with GAF and PtsI domain
MSPIHVVCSRLFISIAPNDLTAFLVNTIERNSKRIAGSYEWLWAYISNGVPSTN